MTAGEVGIDDDQASQFVDLAVAYSPRRSFGPARSVVD
ncbi:hypothetical protein EBESD8_15830 [Rhodococcus aetherivorans]|nr:hypothetical protein EBESD8_15830 [Rhodococcus aetherivorans]